MSAQSGFQRRTEAGKWCFVLIATHGQYRFFDDEANVSHDIRRLPFKLGGYNVSHLNGHASVCIDQGPASGSRPTWWALPRAAPSSK